MKVVRRSNFVVGLALLVLLGGRCFAPPYARHAPTSLKMPRSARTALSAARNDAIQVAAAELSQASYPFMKQVDWSNELYWTVPGANPVSWARAIAKIIDHGAEMDMELVKAGCIAHHEGIRELSSKNAVGVCSQDKLTDIYATIGRMIASVPESKTMEVYNAVSALVDKNVPAYLMSSLNEADAKAAYSALIKFTEVVKANPITPSTSPTTVSSEKSGAIDAAADKLAAASYDFVKSIDWSDELYGKTVPGRTAGQTLKAVDSMIMMGAKMDGAALQEAAKAHVKAIDNMDEKGILTLDDYKATLAGIGKTVASVDRDTVMGVYNEMSKLVGSTGVPQYVFSKQQGNAFAAYNGLMGFKDTVRDCQPQKVISDAAAELAKASYPFMKRVDWNSDLYWTVPGADPIRWARAIAKIIDMGVAMDMELVKAGCMAHHDAILDVEYKSDLVCSEDRLAEIYATIGQMIASVPESKTMDVYNAVSELVDDKVPAYLMSSGSIREQDAKSAYDALMKFTQVVKANPITSCNVPTTISAEGASSISAAADALASASYPFVQGIDWTDMLYGKTVPGKSAKEALKAVDSMIVMGAKMDGAALREAGMAHVKAIENMDAKGILTKDDYKATLAGIGKTVASVDRDTVMKVFDETTKLVSGTGVPQYVLSKQNPSDAMNAYNAFMGFKDTVQKEQPGSEGGTDGNSAVIALGAIVAFLGYVMTTHSY